MEKSYIGDLVVTWHETMDTLETTLINCNNKTHFLYVVLLGILYLLMLVFITDKYYMKRGLIISCLLFYYYKKFEFDKIDVFE